MYPSDLKSSDLDLDSFPGISRQDDSILSLFHPIVRQWWLSTFGGAAELFTPPQRQAVPLISRGDNVLICSPTGSGKTLSAFISILNRLVVMAGRGELENSIYCLYISPLKSLANDIHRNLERPLSEMQALAMSRQAESGSNESCQAVQEIRHAIRHGDVSARDKARMLTKTPHILNTTPESLAILLSSPRFREKLKTVRWVIVDEIHSLAASKRGVHLSLSLERLEERPYDLLLMDIQMPEMDGMTTLARIRREDRFRDLRIIALTAHAMKGDEDKYLRAGFNDYIAKPIEIQGFMNVIRRHLITDR